MSIALRSHVIREIDLEGHGSPFVFKHQLLLPVLGLLAASRRSGQQLFHLSQLSSAKFNRPSNRPIYSLAIAGKKM